MIKLPTQFVQEASLSSEKEKTLSVLAKENRQIGDIAPWDTGTSTSERAEEWRDLNTGLQTGHSE